MHNIIMMVLTKVINLPATPAINFLWAGQPVGTDGWLRAEKVRTERGFVTGALAVRAAEKLCKSLRCEGAQFIITVCSLAGTTFTWTHLDHYITDRNGNVITDEMSLVCARNARMENTVDATDKRFASLEF